MSKNTTQGVPLARGKVVVAMSGGVDSSVAAALMVEQGYEVIGVFLKCWSDTKEFSGRCSWKEERSHAQRVAKQLRIPLITIDAEEEYRKYVVEEMYTDYKRGITPNPDVLCNEVVKFPFLFKQMKKLGAQAVVTGHFANILKRNGNTFLYRGKDETKDQSYFLYRLTEKDLLNLIFPIGKYTKKEVREMAKKRGFLNSEKKSTVGICFIGKVDLKDFLKEELPTKKGLLKDPEGTIVGEHDGVWYYTIGQRLGPRYGITLSKKDDDKRFMKRWYVATKDVKKNEIIVAPEGHKALLRKKIKIKKFHIITGNKKEFLKNITREGIKLHARIRHVGELLPATLFYHEKKITIRLHKAITGVSDGQAIVLYKGKKVLGGGEIAS